MNISEALNAINMLLNKMRSISCNDGNNKRYNSEPLPNFFFLHIYREVNICIDNLVCTINTYMASL